MILRCVRHELWRLRYAVGFFFLSAVTAGLFADHGVAPWWLLAACVFSFGFNYGFPIPARERAALPVSRRQAWLVRWGLVVGWPAMGFFLAMAAGGWLGSWFGGSGSVAIAVATVALLFYVGYTGTFMSLVALCERFAAAGRKRAERAAAVSAQVVLFSALPVAFIWRESMPPAWLDLVPPSPGSLLWLLVLPGLVSVLHYPAAGVYGRLVNPHFEPVVTTARSAPRRWQGWHERLTSLPKLVLLLVRTRGGIMVGVVALVVLLLGAFQWTGDVRLDFLVFDGMAVATPALFLLALMAISNFDIRADLPDKPLAMLARHLRVLPIGRSRFIAVLMARRAVGWLSLWGVTLVAQSVLVGVPSSPRFDVLVCVVGIDLLVDAWRLWAGRSAEEGFFVAGLAVGGAGAAVLTWSDGGATLISVAAGAVGLAALATSVPIYRTAIGGTGSLYSR